MLVSSKFAVRKMGSAAAAFTVFQPSGMLMAKPVALTLSELPATDNTSPPATTIAREGYVSLLLLPRTVIDETEKSASFDKEKRVSIKLRARQIGQIISWKNNGILAFNAYNSAAATSSSSQQVAVEMKAVNNPPVVPRQEVPQEAMIQLSVSSPGQQLFTMPIPVGEFKAFQILLEAALPFLYGWIPKQQSSSLYNNKSSSQKPSFSKSPEDFFKQFQTS